jgi:hypothetical protein
MNDSAFSDMILPGVKSWKPECLPSRWNPADRGSIWHWIAGFRAPIVMGSYQPPTKTVVEETLAVASPTTEVRPEGQINSAIPSAPDEGEIQRRRNLVRTFFNDFWSGSYEKPAGFVERLDQAEDYVNDRLAANGEAWRLDNKTRVMLGLPSRVNSTGAPLYARRDLADRGEGDRRLDFGADRLR